MYLIVGLGNPESDYANTRHNMGFDVINKLAKEYGINICKKKFNSEYEISIIEGKKIILVKPQTYMNASGEAVIQFVNFYKIEMEKILIIYDDIDIDPGKIRIRKNGSSGNHKGMESIIHCLNSQNFSRIRVGIGKPYDNKNMIEHVIGYVPEEDKKILDNGIEIAKNAIIELLKNGIDSSMNKYNWMKIYIIKIRSILFLL